LWDYFCIFGINFFTLVIMAYNTETLYKQAVKAIEENNLFFIEDIVAFIPCSKPTFYEHFPVDSNELNSLKDLLDENKIKTKSEIRGKLGKSEKAAELLALYRLIATPEEHQKLNQSYVDHTSKGKEITSITRTIIDESKHNNP
jgi:hypothetical protein